MVLAFIDLYRSCMKGKRFQQEWMVNINKYFDEELEHVERVTTSSTDRREQHKLWSKVTGAAAGVGFTLDILEKRIVVSTLCYIVYDLMVDKVRDYKVLQSVVSTSTPTSSEFTIKLREY